jgi:hypothetical protein
LQALAQGTSFLNLRRGRLARLLDQALAQGGVLAQTDLAALTLTSEQQVGSDIAQVQRTERRSHKVQVARLLEAGYLEPEICRRLSPTHSLRSVEHYAQLYKNVLKLLEQGFAPAEISSILSLNRSLLNQYIHIVKEHHPEVLNRNGHFQPQPEIFT